MIEIKGTECLLKVKSKKGISVDTRSPKSTLRKVHIGDVLKAQYELTTKDGCNCFWLVSFGVYLYFPVNTVDIYQLVS